MIKGAEKGCVLIPCYKEGARIASVVTQVLEHCPNVLVVDDGSADDTAEAARKSGAVVLIHEINKGKGTALNTGYQWARENKMEFVITMDGDGQHAPADVSAFIETYFSNGIPVLIGNRMDNKKDIPWFRRMTNLFMSWLISRKMGQWVPDTQNGFRLYRTNCIPEMELLSPRFAAESEILLEIALTGVKMEPVSIQVIYSDEKSKIHPMKDAFRFFRMLRDFDKRIQKRKKTCLL